MEQNARSSEQADHEMIWN